MSLELRQFISRYITSVAQLEVLLLLQTNPRQAWSPDAIARELRIEPAGALEQLLLLVSRGLASETQESPPPVAPPLDPKSENHRGFRYAPATPELSDAVVALAQAYLIRRVTVVGLIYARPEEKGPDPARALAESFRLRKSPPSGPPKPPASEPGREQEKEGS